MTKQKRIQKEIEVESFIYHFIRRAGSFDYWLDDYWLFPQVAYSCQCSWQNISDDYVPAMKVSNWVCGGHKI